MSLTATVLKKHSVRLKTFQDWHQWWKSILGGNCENQGFYDEGHAAATVFCPLETGVLASSAMQLPEPEFSLAQQAIYYWYFCWTENRCGKPWFVRMAEQHPDFLRHFVHFITPCDLLIFDGSMTSQHNLVQIFLNNFVRPELERRKVHAAYVRKILVFNSLVCATVFDFVIRPFLLHENEKLK